MIFPGKLRTWKAKEIGFWPLIDDIDNGDYIDIGDNIDSKCTKTQKYLLHHIVKC
jgi:hypothetical protein